MSKKNTNIQTLPQAGLKIAAPKNTKFIDRAAYFVGVVGNLAVLPQLIRAWQGPAPGLAVLTWVLFVLIGVIWLLYAIAHDQKPLIFAQTINIVFNLTVVFGWFVHQVLTQ